jgi:two-component system phosphate regulon sensor histidine kinase PhoR
LLTIARLESRVEKLRLETVAPRALIEDIVADWKLRAGKKKITLSSECAENAPEFEADALRIEQVLNNLVDNAVKYTEAGGSVSLKALPCDGGIEFCVGDTGMGITPQDLPHIFERFYRVDRARSRDLGGTGLGLSIVKHIVQLHGGSVRAESRFGEGTSIFLRLPLVQSPAAHSTPQPSREVKPSVDQHQDQSELHLIP